MSDVVERVVHWTAQTQVTRPQLPRQVRAEASCIWQRCQLAFFTAKHGRNLSETGGINAREPIHLQFWSSAYIRQSEGSLIRGFDSPRVPKSSPNSNPNPNPNSNSNPRLIYSTYMTVGLSNPRINGPSDYRYMTHTSLGGSAKSPHLCCSWRRWKAGWHFV